MRPFCLIPSPSYTALSLWLAFTSESEEGAVSQRLKGDHIAAGADQAAAYQGSLIRKAA